MKKVMIAAAIAGCASVSGAQNFSLSLVPSTSTIDQSGFFTISVYGDADIGTHMLGGAFSIESNSDLVQSMEWTPASWSAFNTDGGHAGNGNYNQVVFGQLVIPGIFPPAPGSDNGSVIGSFLIQIDPTPQFFTITFDLVAGSPFTLETVDSVTGNTFQSSSGNLTLFSTTISQIPAPGVLSMLGLGGLAASRRRR